MNKLFIVQNITHTGTPNDIRGDIGFVDAPNTFGQYDVVITTVPVAATYTSSSPDFWISTVDEYAAPRTTTVFVEANTGDYRAGVVEFVHQDGVTSCLFFVYQDAGSYSYTMMGMSLQPVVFTPIGIDNLL